MLIVQIEIFTMNWKLFMILKEFCLSVILKSVQIFSTCHSQRCKYESTKFNRWLMHDSKGVQHLVLRDGCFHINVLICMLMHWYLQWISISTSLLVHTCMFCEACSMSPIVLTLTESDIDYDPVLVFSAPWHLGLWVSETLLMQRELHAVLVIDLKSVYLRCV